MVPVGISIDYFSNIMGQPEGIERKKNSYLELLKMEMRDVNCLTLFRFVHIS